MRAFGRTQGPGGRRTGLPSVVFRSVWGADPFAGAPRSVIDTGATPITNGFRSVWGADPFAGVRSVIDTGRHQYLIPFQAIRNTLDRSSVIIAA